MIKPLQLGNRTFPVNLIQGPLAGVSCAPFRRLAWKYSQPAFACTEMISCKTLIHQSKQTARRYIEKHPQEGPVCFQLSGNDPAELAEAVKMVTAYGADLIDLNCGCPVKKIRSKGAGSRLLTDTPRLYQLIQAMKKNTHVPVSVKIRVQTSNEPFNVEVAAAICDAGADFVIVHGRHWTEHYDTTCRYEEIQYFVEHMQIPVIGNGDIRCIDSLRKMFATGCAGVMISRAGMGQPWLIQKLIAQMQENHYSVPTQAEIAVMFIEHVQQLAKLLDNEKFAVLQARKFAKYYVRELPARVEFIQAINQCENINHLITTILHYCHAAQITA